jgi:hypothetical protein
VPVVGDFVGASDAFRAMFVEVAVTANASPTERGMSSKRDSLFLGALSGRARKGVEPAPRAAELIV